MASKSAKTQRNSASKNRAGSGQSSKPSAVLNPPTVNPFSNKEVNSSSFATVYTNGGLPCRLVHGSVKHKLAWDTPPESLPSYDPILVTMAEGLSETRHPYTFVASAGFREMLAAAGASAKTLPLLSRLVTPMRQALSHPEIGVFEVALSSLLLLSNVVGSALNPSLKFLLVPLSKRLAQKHIKDKIVQGLQTLESNGGSQAVAMIKQKIPAYASI